MSDILCKWLNEELRLSKVVEPTTFAKDFSSGYLIGEVLKKYGMLNDISVFTKTDTSMSKLNNFTHLEPTLHLLGISFDLATAQGLMQEKVGVATHLLYQLYVSLEKKRKSEMSKATMEIIQPVAITALPKKDHHVFSDRFSHVAIKRDAEVKLQKITQHYTEKKHSQMDSKSAQKKSQNRVQDEKRGIHLKKFSRPKYSDIITIHNQATDVQVPKPPPYSSLLNLRRQKQHQRKEQQAQIVQAEIALFETNRKKLASSGFASSSGGLDPSLGGSTQVCARGGNELMLESSSKYIQDIRRRLQENEAASEQREKRRNKCLIEQLKAHEAQEGRRREEQLVRYLTGQTLQEKRLAVQLLQMRKQKDAFRQNRLLREEQFQQQREKEFREALEREAALTRQAHLDCAEEIRLELEFCKKMAEECARNRSKKHFEKCKEIVEHIVDLATKVGEYRLLTANLIPAKVMHEWKELLLNGLPLYEQSQPGHHASDIVELQKQEILNNQDYNEYTNMAGEWTWPEEAGETFSVPSYNLILRHVLLKLRSMAPPQSPLLCPGYRIKACVLGKFCSGKTTCLKKIAEELKISVLSVDTLVKEALTAHKNGEVTEEEDDTENKILLKYGELEIADTNLSARALLGGVAAAELSKGSVIPDELLVDILVEAIRHIPPESGWILDGFPVNIDQANLLETALCSVDKENETEGRKIDLVLDPNPPTHTPPPPTLDLVVVLNISDHSVAKRAIHHDDRRGDSTADKKLYVAQIPRRIAAFHENWPKLHEWFGSGGRKGTLMKVNADVQKEDLYKTMKRILHKTIMRKREASTAPPVEEVTLETSMPLETSRPLTPVQIEQTPSVTHDEVNIEESELNHAEDRDISQSDPPTEPAAKEVSSGSLPNEELQEAPPVSSSPVPGCPGWVYVDEPVSMDKSDYLCQQWDAICDFYVSSVKSVMQELRLERTIIDHHLYDVREEFRQYLERPDLKQELVSQWQKDYNSIPDDLRQNEETKAELNHRLEDLREHLWDIVDTHKLDDETQRSVLIGEKWLEDHTIVLVNHHLRLIQVEMSRFQNTRNILRDYYLNASQQDHIDCITFLENSDMGPAAALPEILISKQDEAFAVISKMVSTEPLQVDLRARELETIPEKEKEKEKEKDKEKEKEKDKEKEKEKSNKKKQATPSPPPAPSPSPAVETANMEKTPVAMKTSQVKNKLIKEYSAALRFEENAAKARIKLVKGHGLALVKSLHSRAEQLFGDMQDWLDTHYVAQLKSIDQLTEVVRHYIEAALQLQNELVLESIHFYFNGDSQLVPSPLRQQSPLASEKATPSMLTIVQLESLYNSFCNEAPSGFISNSEFFHLISDMAPFNTLPEPWMNMTDIQLNEIISLLMNESKQIDWRQFLLSAALPWPFPSLTALLAARQLFKAADADGTAFISEEEYLQTELWFAREDSSERSHHDRLAKLRKFFFQLFADHSYTPPRLDYMSMLLYFTSDPDPKQGFIRALSVMTGFHLKYPHVTSETNTEEAVALHSSDSKKEDNQEEEEDFMEEQQMSIPILLSVLCPEVSKMKGGLPLPQRCLIQEENKEYLVQIFADLGYTPEDCVPFSVLLKHSIFQNLIDSTDNYLFVNIHNVLQAHQPRDSQQSTN